MTFTGLDGRGELIQRVIWYVLDKFWPDEEKAMRFAVWYADTYPEGDKSIPDAWDYYCRDVEHVI